MESEERPKLTYPYARQHVIAPGEPMDIWLSVPGPRSLGAPSPNEEAVWESGDETVLSIQSEGYFRRLIGHRPGTAKLIVKWKGHVIEQPVHVVDLDRVDELFLDFDYDRRLKAFRARAWYKPGLARDVTSDPGCVWSSSNPAAISFDPQEPGVILTGSNGPAELQLSFRGRTATCLVEHRDGVVYHLRNEITADGRDFLIAGLRTELRISLLRSLEVPGHAGVEIAVSPPDAARTELISGFWHITAVHPGIVTITARCGALVAEAKLPVREIPVRLYRLEISDGYRCGDSHCVFVGAELWLSIQLRYGDDHYLDPKPSVTWESSNPKVIEFSVENGLRKMIAREEGESVITARCLDQVVEQRVRVIERPEIQWF